MEPPPERIVTLVLADREGAVLGMLPPFPASTPWWQDAGPVVDGARDRFGVDITVLRLLDTELPVAHGGRVTYLAEAEPAALAARRADATLRPWTGALTDDPLRRPYARPGGPAADLAWADTVLTGLANPRTGPARQVRTWNLSSLWRLPTREGGAWLKVVPPFFGHEGRILERLAGRSVPRLLGRDGERMLLAEIEGEDRYDADAPLLLEMIDLLVGLQRDWMGREQELVNLGLPDWRGARLESEIAEAIERTADDLPSTDRATLASFVATLPQRLAAIDACGLAEGLVHGDFHPGNIRGNPGHLVLLDWGDSGIGHPLLDQPAFQARIADTLVDAVRAYWHEAWRRAVPGSDPVRAATLLAPLAAARQAVVYRRFLDGIEASERAYHRADVPDWLERTAALLRTEHQPVG